MNHLFDATPNFELILRPFKKADSHNFGKFVTKVDSSCIYKPRSVFWEWLFLGESPLRTVLDSHPNDIFKSLPLLYFNTENYNHGNVELCTVDSKVSLNELNIIQIGAVIGLMSYFGITDLHKDNMVCGTFDGRFIFGPLDIETVFDNVKFPAQTLLLPSRLIAYNRCGVSSLFGSQNIESLTPNMIFKLAFGYLNSLEFLEENSTYLNSILVNLIAKYNPVIRRILRSTGDYYSFLENLPIVNSSLIPSEVIQISRGDIPYYFKYTNADEIYYYSNEGLTEFQLVTEKEFDNTSLIQNLTFDEFSKTLYARINELKTSGLLQILRMIDAEERSQHFKMGEFSVHLARSEIIVESKAKAFKCKRVRT